MSLRGFLTIQVNRSYLYRFRVLLVILTVLILYNGIYLDYFRESVGLFK